MEKKKKKKKKDEEDELKLIKPPLANAGVFLLTDAHGLTLSIPDELTVCPDSVVTYSKEKADMSRKDTLPEPE